MARGPELLHRRRRRRARDRGDRGRCWPARSSAVVVGAVLIALVVVAGLIKRTATDYMVTNQRLYIRRGILSKKVQQTRIDRVQNVNTDQRFRDRLLRVGTVDFDTAGTDDSEFRFVGISDPVKVAAAVDQAQRDAAATAREPPARAIAEREVDDGRHEHADRTRRHRDRRAVGDEQDHRSRAGEPDHPGCRAPQITPVRRPPRTRARSRGPRCAGLARSPRGSSSRPASPAARRPRSR